MSKYGSFIKISHPSQGRPCLFKINHTKINCVRLNIDLNILYNVLLIVVAGKSSQELCLSGKCNRKFICGMYIHSICFVCNKLRSEDCDYFFSKKLEYCYLIDFFYFIPDIEENGSSSISSSISVR